MKLCTLLHLFMKKWFFCFWILSICAYAQKTDSLLRLLGKLPADTSKVSVLYELGQSFWLQGNDSLSRLYSNQSVSLAHQVHDLKGEVKARLLLVRIENEYLSDLKTAYNHLDKALEIAKSIPDKLLEGQVYFRRAQIYTSFFEKQAEVQPLFQKALALFTEINDKAWQGYVYAEMASLLVTSGKHAEGIDLMLKARKLQEETNNIMALRSVVPNLGSFYSTIGRYENALACFKEAEIIAEKLSDNRVKAFVLSQRGEIFEKQGKYKKALETFEQAAQIHRISNTIQALSRTYGRIGGVYILLGNYDQAFKYTQAADSLYKSQIDSNESLDHLNQINFGKIFLAKKQYKRVIQYAKEGIEWASESDPPLRREIAEYHRQLAEAYEALKQPQLSLYHFKQYKTQADSLLNNEALQKITVSSMTYEFEKKQQGNKIRIQELENQQLTRTRNFLLGFSFIGVFGVGFVMWSNRKLKNKNQQLKLKNKEIEEALFKGQRIERKRVASELHDNLNTKLAAVRWHLEAMQEENLNDFNKKIYTRLLDMANDVYADVRLISHNMLPAELETQGLIPAIEKLVEKLNINTKTTFHLIAQPSSDRLPSETEHQLYNITLELINNIIKHAQASEVWISYSHTDIAACLSVSDNGIGMTDELQSEGIGMTNLNNRVATLSGKLTFQSKPEVGTKATIEVPI